ncbi:MAG: hypothetical protein JWN76_496 [Chitinophagaceae bacterium]|nr:hypothetical protein [Chitinophagaceae bacterium]
MSIAFHNNVPINTSPPLEDVRSEAVQDLISKKPEFLLRWGNVIFLAVFVLVITTSFFIRYPDTVDATATLQSLNAPKPIISQVDGKLVSLKVHEGDYIQSGKIIGFMESTANHEEVLQLSGQVDQLYAVLTSSNTITAFDFPRGGNKLLGEMQQEYQIFIQALLTYSAYLPDGYVQRKRSLLVHEVGNIRKLRSNIEEQKINQEKDLALTQWSFDMNERLRNEKVISEQEYKDAKSKLINKQQIIPQSSASLIVNENVRSSKQKEILELENTVAQQKTLFIQATSTFMSKLDQWKKNFILTSLSSGHIRFNRFLQENEQLKIHETIAFVTPKDNQYYVELHIPQNNFGKVKPGQDVLLKFNAYPFQEFGSVRGIIQYISPIPSDNGFIAKVLCPQGLITNYHRTLTYNEGLTAHAEIVTLKRSLLQRLYLNLYSGTKK